jgi:hypothetical protein
MTKTKGTTAGMKSRGAHIHDMTAKKNVAISPSNGLKPGLQTAAPAPAVKPNLINLALNANKR